LRNAGVGERTGERRQAWGDAIMRNILKALAAILMVASALTFSAGWYYATSEPPQTHLALSEPLIDVRSAEGRAFLASTEFRADFDRLSAYFTPQARRGYCGVASATMVINALRMSTTPLSQETFFTPKASAVRSSLKVSLKGMSLEDLADLLRAHDLQVSIVHASNSSLDAFREAARDNLVDPSDFLLVNYDRVTLHQKGRGHISPVVAYDPGSDRFLVLDVAAHKYPPTWVPAADLWKAMNTSDTPSGKTRGFVLVREADGMKRLATAQRVG
jgi:hypothetical protein